MDLEIDTAFRNQYRDNFIHLVQQSESRLMVGVDVSTDLAPGEQLFIDQIGPLDFIQLAGRHSPTKNTDPDHFRRQLVPVPFTVAPLVDTQDRLRAVADPTSAFSEAVRKGSNRLIDDTIITAATGTANTGKNGGTPVALPAAQIVPVDYVEGGGSVVSNLTVGKLRRAKEIFDNNDVDLDDRHLALSPNALSALLRDPEATSRDFVDLKALIKGEISEFMGFTFHPSTRLAIAANIRTNFAWRRDGITLGFLENPVTRIDERPDLNYSTQVYGRVDLGATRTQEELVVSLLGDETK